MKNSLPNNLWLPQKFSGLTLLTGHTTALEAIPLKRKTKHEHYSIQTEVLLFYKSESSMDAFSEFNGGFSSVILSCFTS